ncbi:MAG: uridylate kinase [Mesorhizobium sp.]|uniref:aspartate kinase n=1 Tax=Mesorhizobium wenxiniae TaxID=2014805 RepID=A0A271KP66_9HYPH|nr:MULTISPECIES: uridylate kinase [Mesorhizobium]MCF6114627.1 uridylate kinase [Mesorhizobium muleiense]PAP97520.1 uridylate kinase [Mesorhizobium wenxiniae]RVD13139.1 uridylate kinase [Mesorhizobium sp. M7A.F.Ca.ET.027.02.1.1]RWC97377.1 MAG: uridylate kinase [Mesorhizobium sp.]RWD40596.1 MAG: uridylate kinase [Mesorhizobium sp.]
MNATILKFGGSSFLHPKDYGRIAGHLADRLAAGEHKIVAVVSAMSGTTCNLKAVMLDVNKQASPSNLDGALATGEMLSASLLEAAISRLGIPAISLNGYSLGIRTNSDFGRASIKSVDPTPILAALQEHHVVVAAGAQAIDQSGRLTFLGRNSSDLSAIAIASMLGEHTCEIYSDVPGVYTADPYLVAGAQLIPEISYRAMLQMSRHGAKVLHHRAVHYAETHNVTIVCKSLTSDGVITGTIVTGHGNARSVTVAREIPVFSCATLEECDNLCALLARHDINAIRVEDGHGVVICIVSDIDFALRLVALSDTVPVFIGSKNVVTELDSSVLRVHVVGDYDRAIALARQIHERMYPAAVGAPSR